MIPVGSENGNILQFKCFLINPKDHLTKHLLEVPADGRQPDGIDITLTGSCSIGEQ